MAKRVRMRGASEASAEGLLFIVVDVILLSLRSSFLSLLV